VPDQPSVDGLEERWITRWEKEHIYRFNPEATRANVFSIDTPPPTVSGTLHIGHVFSYTHSDVVARFCECAARTSFTPWAGTTTVCDRAPRRELLRRAL